MCVGLIYTVCRFLCFFSSRRRHTICALVTGVQTCALPISFHASELPYVFGQIGSDAALPPNWPRPEGQDEQRLSRVMMDYWVAFARNGAPAAPDAPAWQAYSEQQIGRASCRERVCQYV